MHASRYSYEPDMTIRQVEPRTGGYWRKEISEKEVVREKVIRGLLCRYKLMTAALLQRCLDNDRRTLKASLVLDRLVWSGEVLRYTISHADGRTADIDIYMHIEGVIRDNGRSGNIDCRARSGQKNAIRLLRKRDIPDILAHLALVQWHLSVLSYRGARETVLFRHISVNGREQTIPSLVRISSTGGRPLSFCGVPAPRHITKRTLEAFIQTLSDLDEYFMEKHFFQGAIVIVVICESGRQIDALHEVLQGHRETASVFTLFSTDEITSRREESALSVFYRLVCEETETEREIYSIV